MYNMAEVIGGLHFEEFLDIRNNSGTLYVIVNIRRRQNPFQDHPDLFLFVLFFKCQGRIDNNNSILLARLM